MDVGALDKALQQLKQNHSFPAQYAVAIGPQQLAATDQYLARCGPTTELVFLLRMPHNVLAEINSLNDPEPSWLLDRMHNGYFFSPLNPATDHRSAYDVIRDDWRRIVGVASQWHGVLRFPTIHACCVRGPTSALRLLLASASVRAQSSPIAGIIRPIPIRVPEHRIDWQVILDADPSVIKRVGDLHHLFENVDSTNSDAISRHAAMMAEDKEIVAAIDLLQKLVQFLPWMGTEYVSDSVRKVLNRLSSSGGYMNGLNIGDVNRFGDSAGNGQRIVVLDSGADESSPWLQRQVIKYARFDPIAQEKRVHDCMDFACHGTKMASLIAGNLVSLHDLGFTDSFVTKLTGDPLSSFRLAEHQKLRIGLCPGAKLAIGGILGGETYAECGGTQQLVAGIEWATTLALEGFGIISISVEADPKLFDFGTRESVDTLFQLMKSFRAAPIIASGNHGADSASLSRNGFIVGAANRCGTPASANGLNDCFLAPGVDVLCGQPKLDRLRGLLINEYSGSSIATAIVAGSVAALCAKHHKATPLMAMKALEITAVNRFISLDQADDLLSQYA